ncbi:hypothetical protein NEIELOOT_00479 [Neisseria elongata subsp. glycolytica ATCC 29315]|uniref:Uncharacterized protein n=1 Tax=Neisseria elongata subsp. glycolytica ATCC 29315 TaxID=546263 RepID=D4DN56_NEIEG|nr:hypothetical protein NEIELOOT_00479 [Neisseria elongata subsp. glycolytica ATCC 29315]
MHTSGRILKFCSYFPFCFEGMSVFRRLPCLSGNRPSENRILTK